MQEKLTDVADKSAIFLSILCLVHCLFLPILVLILPAVSALGFFADEHFHQLLIFVIIPISFIALLSSYIRFKNWSIIGFIVFGVALITFAAFLGHDLVGHVGEVVLTVIGSIFIAYGHTKNLSLRRQSSVVNDNNKGVA